MKKVKISFFSIVLTIFTTVLVIFNIYMCYKKIVLDEDIVKIFGYSGLVIVSGSMEPTLDIDDLIIIKEETYKEQDIVTFKDGKSFVTHRIIKIEDDLVYTKGDNNNAQDRPISKSQIEGKVIYKINGFGRIISLISSPVGILIILMIIFLIIKSTIKNERR